MKYYWESFLDEYTPIILGTNLELVVILEAFWNYCNGRKEEAERILRECSDPEPEPNPKFSIFTLAV